MEIYGRSTEVELKKDKSPLTAADRASHRIIEEGLLALRPDLPVLSEEGRDIPYSQRKGWNAFWLVDPLDGTKEFIRRNGEFTVNIALIEKGSPVFGLVYSPALEKLYWGMKGRGAWLADGDGEPKAIGVRRKDPDSGLTVVMSRSHPSPELDAYLKTIKVSEVVSIGSSLKFCLVAEGEADLYPRFGPTMEWDTAAGQAVLEAAGGYVLNRQTGERLSYNKESLLNPFFLAGAGS